MKNLKNLKWTREALGKFKSTGEELKMLGMKAMREIQDRDCHSVLTFWAGLDGSVVIQQTWVDTGDVVLYRTITELEFDGMKSQVGDTE